MIDENRSSVGSELLAMKRIREKIHEFDSSGAIRLHKMEFFSVSELKVCSKIINSYNNIRENKFIGSQYEWLARLCESQNISGLQLCAHEDDKEVEVIIPMVTMIENSEGSFKIDSQYSGTDEYNLFKYFEFPVLKLTKKGMAKISKEHGWESIMEMTWFCHNPIDGKPCGRCNPCLCTAEQGFAWRIPAYRLYLGKIYHFARTFIKPIVRNIFSDSERKRELRN